MNVLSYCCSWLGKAHCGIGITVFNGIWEMAFHGIRIIVFAIEKKNLEKRTTFLVHQLQCPFKMFYI